MRTLESSRRGAVYPASFAHLCFCCACAASEDAAADELAQAKRKVIGAFEAERAYGAGAGAPQTKDECLDWIDEPTRAGPCGGHL